MDTDLIGIILAEYGLTGALEVQNVIVIGITELKDGEVLIHPAVEADRERYDLDRHSRLLGGTNKVVELAPPGFFIPQQPTDGCLIDKKVKLRRIASFYQEPLAFHSDFHASSHRSRLKASIQLHYFSRVLFRLQQSRYH